MLNNITSLLQGSDNLHTAWIVGIYALVVSILVGALGGLIRSFRKPTINKFYADF